MSVESNLIRNLIDRVYNQETKVGELEVAVAKHDVKLNLIAFIASGTFIGVLSIILKMVFIK